MHKRIIKYTLVLLATASSIFAWNYTKGYEIIENCFTNNRTTENQCRDITNEAFQYENGYNIITNNMNFTYQGVQDYNTFFLNNLNYFLYRGTDNELHIKNGVYTGRVGNICSYGSNNISEIGAYCGIGVNREGTYGCHKNYTTDVEELYNSGGGFDKVYWLPGRVDGAYNNGAGGVLCMIKGNGAYCILLNNGFSPNSNNNCASRYNANIYTGYVQDNNIQNYGLSELETEFATSPFNGGNSGGGGGTTTITTGNICPMIQFQIDMYGNKYNTGLCYTNTIEYTGGSIQTVTPKDIFEIFNSYTDYINRYNLWNNSCHAPYTQEYCNNVMQDNWRATQIFNKIEKAGVNSEKVYQYCHLQLHFTEEQKRTLGTCQIETETDQQQYATGTNQQNSNPNPLEGINNALQNGTLDEAPVPNTGTVFDEILPEGVLSRKDVIMDYNFYSHFSMLYIKITKLFQARGEQDGILPEYITSLLLLILLFKIYKK